MISGTGSGTDISLATIMLSYAKLQSNKDLGTHQIMLNFDYLS
jgi:hypothetical protein